MNELDNVLSVIKADMAKANEAPAQAEVTPNAPAEAPAAAEQPATPAAEPVATTAEQPKVPEAPAAPTAPTAPTVPPVPDYNALLNQQSNTIQRLEAELAKRDAAAEQQSKLAEKGAEEALSMPMLSFENIAFDDDDARNAVLAKYNTEMAEYMQKAIASKVNEAVGPMAEHYRATEAQAKRDGIKARMRSDAKFSDFANVEKRVDAIVATDPDLAKMDPDKAYATAYLMVKGLNGMQPQPQRAASDIAKEVLSNPEVMRIIEEQRVQKAAQAQAAVPPIPGGGNAVPATPPTSPKNLKEARELAMKSFFKRT